MLGLTEGDYLNLLSGSATGTLLPGHEYSVSFGAWINTLELVTDPGATAAGSLSLIFVPEPASLLLLASGVAALAWREGRSARRGPKHDRRTYSSPARAATYCSLLQAMLSTSDDCLGRTGRDRSLLAPGIMRKQWSCDLFRRASFVLYKQCGRI